MCKYRFYHFLMRCVLFLSLLNARTGGRNCFVGKGGSLFAPLGRVQQASVEDNLPSGGAVPARVHLAWSGS